MMISRRTFLGSTACVGGTLGIACIGSRAGAASLFRHVRLDSTYFQWTKLADGVHGSFGEGGNSLLIIAKGECVMVDSKNTGFGAALRREAEALAAVPCKTLINTHHHFDHTGGNSAFTGDAAKVIAG